MILAIKIFMILWRSGAQTALVFHSNLDRFVVISDYETVSQLVAIMALKIIKY